MIFETLLLRERFFVYGLDFRGLCMGLLKINGKEEIFPDNKMPATIADLLRQLGVDSTTVVAELEGQIIESKNFSTTPLHAGQNNRTRQICPGGLKTEGRRQMKKKRIGYIR